MNTEVVEALNHIQNTLWWIAFWIAIPKIIHVENWNFSWRK